MCVFADVCTGTESFVCAHTFAQVHTFAHVMMMCVCVFADVCTGTAVYGGLWVRSRASQVGSCVLRDR